MSSSQTFAFCVDDIYFYYFSAHNRDSAREPYLSLSIYFGGSTITSFLYHDVDEGQLRSLCIKNNIKLTRANRKFCHAMSSNQRFNIQQ